MSYTINSVSGVSSGTYIGDPLSAVTITGTGNGSAGQIYTTNGTGAINWNNLTSITSDTNLQGTTLKVKGDAEFDGDVTIKGKSINDSLERIEERLAILRPNEELEAKWEELRNLRKAYMDLERDLIEKEKMWGILKR